MTQAAPLEFQPPVLEEEQARADCYALLARLYYAGPDAALLGTIAAVGDTAAAGADAPLGEAWRALAAAARAADPASMQPEYDAVLVGTGRSPVTPYFTHYLMSIGGEKLLARLRGELAGLGLARREAAREPEDHIAALCDVMRHLIASGSGNAALQGEKLFFDRYIRPGYPAFCDALEACEGAGFYRSVARFTRVFFDIESASFEML